ncbi:hypothetical protein COT29_01750 [Candidatus Micrarchaeota archaeon CG08_land_8_20_14_0_20_59_11]|nr:MAG: hypothetical protein COT29_01750 [Candidatus Micrarchaeota archaeon CG08_land_8_20_14_0_20_59_11]
MNIVVSGGQGGIGKAVVRELSKGRRRRIFSLDIAGGRSKGNVEVRRIDLTNHEETAALIGNLCKKYGQIGVLINCVGYYGVGDCRTFSAEEWRKNLSVNAEAPALLAVECSKHMPNGGKIINVTSAAAYLGSRDIGYSAAKAALAGATKSLALNLACRGIDVLNVAPGIVDTQMSRRMPEKRRLNHVKKLLSGRSGKPKEIASIIRYLVEADTTYLRGSTIHINGGEYLQ